MDADLRRTKVPVGDCGPDETDEIRVYFDPDSMAPAPSVSVIKGLRVDPEKESTLEGWRQRYDGKSQWARPWWKDQRQYKAYRGTLIHFTVLSALGDLAVEATDTLGEGHDPSTAKHTEGASATPASSQKTREHLDASGDTYFHEVGDSGYGYEEYYAEYTLKKWSKKAPSANCDDTAIQPPRQNKYDGEHAWDRAVREMRWAAKAFDEQLLGDRIRPEDVLGVETFVCSTDYNYAGQLDLLYERDGTTVVCDLKTSSAIRFDHKLQASAYANAVEECLGIEVDECEVLRLYPDDEDVEVSTSKEWDRTVEGLTHEFLGLADEAQVVYDEPLEQAAEDLTDTVHSQSSQDTLDE